MTERKDLRKNQRCRSGWLSWKSPAMSTRPPSIHVSAVLFVIGAELPTQGGLFIEQNEEVHSHGSSDDCCVRGRVGVAKYNPQSNPAHRKAQIHGIAHITIAPTTSPSAFPGRNYRHGKHGCCSRGLRLSYGKLGNMVARHFGLDDLAGTLLHGRDLMSCALV
jgi:hypothetical protein